MEKKMKASEMQISGNHYKDFPIQPAEFCQRNRLNWCEANVVKYVCRHASKKGAEDLRKAKHYIDLLLEWEYPETNIPVDVPHKTSLRERMMDAKEEAAKGVHISKWYAAESAKAEFNPCDSCNENSRGCMAAPNACSKYVKAKEEAPKPAPVALEICPSCDQHPGCKGTVEPAADGSCKGFSAKEAASDALDFFLPSIALVCSCGDIRYKFKEELAEFEATSRGSMEELIEAWDCIQVAQTYREHGGCVEDVPVGNISSNLKIWHDEGLPVLRAKRAMLIKNAARAMYSDKDNAAILATV